MINTLNKNCCYVVRFSVNKLTSVGARYYCGVKRHKYFKLNDPLHSTRYKSYATFNEFSAKLLTKAGATKTAKRVAEELCKTPVICKVDFDKLAESNFVVCDGNVVDLYQKKQTIDDELAFMGMFEVVDNGNQYYTS